MNIRNPVSGAVAMFAPSSGVNPRRVKPGRKAGLASRGRSFRAVVIDTLEGRRLMTGTDPTVAVVTESAASINQGGQVVFSVAVTSPNPGTSAATPTGTVTWRDDGSVRGTTPLDGNGRSSLSMWLLSAGTHSVTASYSGDGTFATVVSTPVAASVASIGPLTLTADVLSPTAVDLAWSAGGVPHTGFAVYRAVAAQAATLVATVPGSATSFVDTGVVPGATYTYSISTLDDRASTNHASATTALPAPAYQGPSTEPAYPAGFDTFSPPVSTAVVPDATSPMVDEYTRTAGPDQTIALTAESLGGTAVTAGNTSGGSPTAGGKPGFVAFGQTVTGNQVQAAGTVQTFSGRTASVTLPSSLPADGLYFVWPTNNSSTGRVQYGTPMVINQPDVTWVDQTSAVPGGTISVFGTNLTHGTDDTHTADESWLYLQPAAGGAGQWITATAGAAGVDVNPYKLDVRLPAGLSTGSYNAWVNNGLGGHWSWSRPLQITVRQPLVGADTPVVRVTALTEAAVSAAIAQAASEVVIGSDVYVDLPSGTIPVTSPLEVRAGVRLVGTGQTVFQVPAGAELESAIDFNSGGQGGLEDVTVDADNGGISLSKQGGDLRQPAVIELGSIDQVLINVKVSDVNPGGASAYDVNSSSGVTRLQVRGCTFTGAGIYFGNANDVVIDDCTFIGAGATVAAIQFNMGFDVSITRNTVENDSNDPSQPWDSFARVFWLAGGGAGIYIGDNTSIGLFPEPTLDSGLNGGEQILSEAGNIFFEGAPVTATSSTITLPVSAGLPGPGWTIAVGAGTGLGQSRIVTGTTVNGNLETLTVDAPWAVIPTTGSTVSLGTENDHVAVYQNTLSGDGVQSFKGNAAGVAFGGFDLTVAGNTISNLPTGIVIWSISKGGSTPGTGSDAGLNYFDLVTGNTISNVKYGLAGMLSSYAPAETCAVMLGTVWRDNTITRVRQDGISSDTPTGIEVGDYVPNPNGQMTTNIFEDDTVTETPVGIEFTNGGSKSSLTGTVQTLVLNDSFGSDGSAASTGLVSDVSEADYAVLQGDTWTGFNSPQDALVAPAVG